jgi:hypothetical protein
MSQPALNTDLLKAAKHISSAVMAASRAEVARHVWTSLKWQIKGDTAAHLCHLFGNMLEGSEVLDLRNNSDGTPQPLFTLLRRNLPHDHPAWAWVICPHGAEQHQPNPQQQYLEDGGTTCPHCGSTAIQASNLEPDGMTADQMVDCQECHASWWDQFHLIGYRDLQPPCTTPEEDEGIPLFHSEETHHED